MISERDVARKFTPIWQQVLPMLTPTFTKVFNESHVIRLSENEIVKPIGHSDLVSEYAFYLTSLTHSVKLKIDEDIPKEIIQQAFQLAKGSIRELNRATEFPENLTEKEFEEGLRLYRNTRAFISAFGKSELVFAPKVPGYGVIPTCQGDISIGESLFEIKTVTRTFRSKDLKQLILYLALQSVTGNRRWKSAGLYNPRLGVYCQFNIDGIIGTLSGGRASQEVFQDLLELLVRDSQIESRF